MRAASVLAVVAKPASHRAAGVVFLGTLAAPPPLGYERDGEVGVTNYGDGCQASGPAIDKR